MFPDLLKTLFCCLGVPLGGQFSGCRMNKVVVPLILLGQAISFVCLIVSTLREYDYVHRKGLLKYIHGFSYLSHVIEVAYLYLWVVNNRYEFNHRVPDRWNSLDQMLTLVVAAVFAKISYDEIIFLANKANPLYKLAGIFPELVIEGLLFTTVRMCGTVIKILVSRLLLSVEMDIVRLLSHNNIPIDILCRSVDEVLLDADQMLRPVLRLLHVNYLVWTLGQFAGELPAASCKGSNQYYIICTAICQSLLVFLIDYRGIRVEQCLARLRCRIRWECLHEVEARFAIKRWGPVNFLLLRSNSLGIIFYGQNILTRKNVAAFISVCWSMGFVLYQVVVQDAMRDWEKFCMVKAEGTN